MGHRSWKKFVAGMVVPIVLLVVGVPLWGCGLHGSPAEVQAVLPGRPGRGPAEESGSASTLRQEQNLPLGWHIECVDCPPAGGGGDRSLALDGQGRPHVVYGGDRLYHAWYDGSAWQNETVDRTLGSGAYAEVAFDATSRAHVIYCRGDTLLYAYWDGAFWRFAVVDRVVGGLPLPSFTLDTAGVPALSYAAAGRLYYARLDGNSWLTETIPAGPVIPANMLAFDPTGHPHISYGDPGGGNHHAWHDGARWYTETVAFSNYPYVLPSAMAVGPTGRLHLVYGHGDGPRYAYSDGSGWYTETIGLPPVQPLYLSLVLDAAGWPHLAVGGWNDLGGMVLHYAWRDETGWHSELVDYTRGGVALVLDDAARPYIRYVGYSDDPAWDGCLKLAHFDGQTWQYETLEWMGAVGRIPVLALDGAGRPRIFYHTGRPEALYPVKYAWFDGTGWHNEVVEGDIWSCCGDLALDATGEPHVVYTDYFLYHVNYAHREAGVWQSETLPVGDAWMGSPVLALDSAGWPHVAVGGGGTWYVHKDEAGWHSELVAPTGYGGGSLALDSLNRPHLVYGGWEEMRYARWDGQSWFSETVTPLTATIECDLALDSADQPRLACGRDGTLDYLWRDGSGWHSETVDQGGDFASLALDSLDRPRISYYDAGRRELHYAWFDGTAWLTATVESVGEHAVQTSLALDGAGWPHIAYYDDTWGDLKYAVGFPDGPWHAFLPLVPGR